MCVVALAGGLSGRAVAGIVVGVIIPIVPICVIVVYCIHRRRIRKRGRFIPKQISMKKVSNAHKVIGVVHSEHAPYLKADFKNC